MTTTSTRMNESLVKYIAGTVAAAALVVTIIAVGQWATPDGRPSDPSPSAAAEAAESNVGPSGLTQALIDGKLDAGLNPLQSPSATGIRSAPQIVIVNGQGGLYDALIAGKFDMDFVSQGPGVHYVQSPDATNTVGGLWAALSAGKLDESRGNRESPYPPASAANYTPTVSGGNQE